MKKYIVSCELAEKLRDACYPQQTIHYWESPNVDEEHYKIVTRPMCFSEHNLAAPMAGELLEQLPDFLMDTQNRHHDDCDDCTHAREYKCFLEIRKSSLAYVSDMHRRAIPYYAKFERLPDGLAELWLWLRNNGYALPCGINQTKVSA